jgi:YesN/AraC family two-component response regulator
MRITLIDDERHNLDLLENLLTKIDSRIEITGKFQNPLEAIPHILSKNPHLVIIDIEMPFVNGVDMIRMLSHTVERFIISSANDSSAFIEKYALAQTLPLTKPFTLPDLKRVIEASVNQLVSNQ